MLRASGFTIVLLGIGPILPSIAFQPRPWTSRVASSSQLHARRTLVKEPLGFDPLHLSESTSPLEPYDERKPDWGRQSTNALAASATALTVASASAHAESLNDLLARSQLTPQQFVPVCGASDGFYRFLQGSTVAVIGEDNFVEYGPLIAGGLLRIRLELCVVESFFNEAVGPFIDKNGLSWVLPLHETVETFVAGVIFSLATTFIMLGSTKILQVIFTYFDFLIGVPTRLFGGFFFDRARGKPVTLDVGLGPFKTRVIGPPVVEGQEKVKYNIAKASFFEILVVITSGAFYYFGELVGLLRAGLDAIDLFVGRYLVFWASFYILLKFIHYKVFPDFP